MERKLHTARCMIAATACVGALAVMPTVTASSAHYATAPVSRTHAAINESVTDDSYGALRIKSYDETVLLLVCHESPECLDFKSFLSALTVMSHTTPHEGHDLAHELPHVAFIDPAVAPYAAASLGASGVASLILLRDGEPQDAAAPRLVGEDLRYADRLDAFLTRVRSLDFSEPAEYNDRYERELTTHNHRDVLAESHDRLVVLEFTKGHCVDCVGLSKTLRRLAAEGDGSWLLAHVGEYSGQPLWQTYRPNGLPALIAVRNGIQVKRLLGFSGNEADYREWLATMEPTVNTSVPVQHHGPRPFDHSSAAPVISRSGIEEQPQPEPQPVSPTPDGDVWQAGQLTLY